MGDRKAFLRQFSDDERIFASHVFDLVDDVWKGGSPYTGFCDVRQQAVVAAVAGREGVQVRFFGGYPDSERSVASLYREPDEPAFPPIRAIRVQSHDPVTHRDILGSVLALGLKRERIGDIIKTGDGQALFVLPPADRLILDELSRVGRQSVRCLPVDAPDKLDIIREYKTIAGTVASPRLDSVVSLCCGVGRAAAADRVKSGKVFVDAVNITNPAFGLKEECRISVRGSGKYLFTFDGRMSGKGRYHVIINKFI